MKQSQLRQLIREEIQKELQEGFSINNYDVKNELGKFFIVTKPHGKNDTLDDICFESDVFHFANQIRGGLAFEEVVGIFKQKSDARREATELLKAYESSLKEIESSMEEYRTLKKDIEEKRKLAKEKIQSLK
jgi:hypothetical protein